MIEQCTTKDNTIRLQCLWLQWEIFTKVKWPFLRPNHSQTQSLLVRYIRLLEQDRNITSNNIVNSYFSYFLQVTCFQGVAMSSTERPTRAGSPNLLLSLKSCLQSLCPTGVSCPGLNCKVHTSAQAHFLIYSGLWKWHLRSYTWTHASTTVRGPGEFNAGKLNQWNVLWLFTKWLICDLRSDNGL